MKATVIPSKIPVPINSVNLYRHKGVKFIIISSSQKRANYKVVSDNESIIVKATGNGGTTIIKIEGRFEKCRVFSEWNKYGVTLYVIPSPSCLMNAKEPKSLFECDDQ